MFCPKTLVLLGLLPFTLAQYGGAPVAAPSPKTTPLANGVAASTTTSSVQTQTVTAGAGGVTDLSWTPNTVMAAPNTFVEFLFMPVNHSIAQSSFAVPCSPANNSFFAGFQFDTSSGPANNTFLLEITGTDPIWFYCPQTTDNVHHCTNGMVGVINPPANETQAMFKINAAAPNVSVVVPATIAGGTIQSINATSTGAAASPSSTGSAASHITVGMGLMSLVGIAFSALLSF